MIRHGDLEIPTTLADLCRPSRCAFLIYDMQIGVVGQIKDGPAITAKVADAAGAARAAGLRVAYTRHGSLPPPWMGVFGMRQSMTWQKTDDPKAVKPWFLRDSAGLPITPELAPKPQDAVFDKLAMSAFEGTPLAFALRDCGLDVMVIAGVALEIGIAPTVRHAADLGVIPVVLTDACGHGDAEAAQRSLDAMRFTGDAVLTDVAAFKAALAAG